MHSTMNSNFEQIETGEPVLLVHGGTPAARQLLMRHLSSSGLAFRLVDVPARLTTQTTVGESDPIEFLQEFSMRLRSVTPKEKAVLDAVLAGQTNKAISVQLDLTERAIELRKASLMKKLSARSHTELVRRITRYETLKQHFFRQFEGSPARQPDR